MKSVIYFFTGTGNTLVAARKIAAGLENCQLLPIVSEYKKGVFQNNASRIIFLFPLYFLSFPKIVMEFIQQFQFEKNVQIICIATRGFKPMGGVISHFRSILKKADLKLTMGFYIDMPSNDVTLFGIHPQEKQAMLLSSADGKITEIIAHIKTSSPVFDPEPFGFMRPLRHGPAYLNHLKTAYKSFYTQETCNGCGICAKACPLENILMMEKRPVWQENCQLCESCINYCPKHAIQFGKNSLKRGRYVHPQISFAEIAKQRPEMSE